MKNKTVLGIFFFLALMTSAVFGSMVENSRQGFEGNFQNSHPVSALGEPRLLLGFELSFLKFRVGIGIISKDPIGFEGGYNLFGYVNNNPLRWFDAWGLSIDEILNILESQGARGGGIDLYSLWYGKYVLPVINENSNSDFYRQTLLAFGQAIPSQIVASENDCSKVQILDSLSKKIAEEIRNSFGPKTASGKYLESLQPVKRKGGRARWKDEDGFIYEWDSQHGELEVYDRNGNHVGVKDPNTGAWTKPRKRGRFIEV